MRDGNKDYVPGRLRYVINSIINNRFGNLSESHGMLKSLMEGNDQYCLCWDFESYMNCQGRVDACYLNQSDWIAKSIYSTARCAKFSTDRTINDYAGKIWNAKPLPIPKPNTRPASKVSLISDSSQSK